MLLLLASAGVVGGATAAYLGAAHTAAPPGSVTVTMPATRDAPAATGSAPSAASTTEQPQHRVRRSPAAVVATGHALNDQGYALIQRFEYAAAVPLLERAVRALHGTGPADPYEGFANYNLGYALLRSGRCNAAVVPLERAARLESGRLVNRALAEAEACSVRGS